MNDERQACLSVIKCQSKEMKIPMLDWYQLWNILDWSWYWFFFFFSYLAGTEIGYHHTSLVLVLD
jgi:hypothetical protein